MITKSENSLWFFKEYHKLKNNDPTSMLSVIELIAKAKIDANPHQIDAVLFGLSNLESNGILLADEVGLGKTIEAGLILSQYFHSGKKKILILPPNSLIEQWEKELKNLFGFSPSVFRRTSEFDANIESSTITIITDHVAKSSKKLISSHWDLIIIDEAHRYRNFVDNLDGRYSAAVKNFKHIRPLLLTATPVQTDIKDFFALISIFRQRPHEEFAALSNKFNMDNIELLADSLSNEVFRTLRKNVHTVNYPPRKVFTIEILENDVSEIELENIKLIEKNFDKLKKLTKAAGLLKSSFLNYYASTPQMCFTVLFNSARAIIGNSEENSLVSRLENIRTNLSSMGLPLEEETEEEDNQTASPPEELQKSLLNIYLDILEVVSTRKIESGKLDALIEQVRICLTDREICPNEKIVIFTQFTTTQSILVNSLAESGVVSVDDIQTFSGNNNSYENIYNFKYNKKILIITDAGCFGLNLQFSNCLINFDFPWNPMTIEQRIGRIHRYGQKFTANVFNTVFSFFEFEKNKYRVLVDRCNISQELFGASSEILSELENHKDYSELQKSIQSKQLTSEEICTRYENMIKENSVEISDSISSMKKNVFDILDEKSRSKIKIDRELLQKQLDDITTFTKILFEVSFPSNWTWLENNVFEVKKRPALLEPKNERQKYQISTSSTTEEEYVRVGFGHPLFVECMKIAAKSLELIKSSSVEIYTRSQEVVVAIQVVSVVGFITLPLPEFCKKMLKESGEDKLNLTGANLQMLVKALMEENREKLKAKKIELFKKIKSNVEENRSETDKINIVIRGIYIEQS